MIRRLPYTETLESSSLWATIPNSLNKTRRRIAITVIIEVKGNWHPELLEAMQDQLSNRYLKEGKTLYGLYLVAWFDSDKWDPNDPRKRKSSKTILQR